VPLKPNQAGYDSEGSETMDRKQAIEQYKRAAEHALLSLDNPSSTNNEDMPETHPDVIDDSFDSESN
jgi:hypothetical protein